jgi:hypothetical protein
MFHSHRHSASSGIVIKENLVPAGSVRGSGFDLTSVEGGRFGIEAKDGGAGGEGGRGIGVRMVFDWQGDDGLESRVPAELLRSHPAILIDIFYLIARDTYTMDGCLISSC